MSAEKDHIKEQLKFNTEIIKILAAFVAITIGGVLSLIIEGIDTS